MIRSKKTIITILIIVTSIGCDQATKTIASHRLIASQPVELIGETFRLEYTENSGAMLGVGAELPDDIRFLLFTVFAGCALFAIFTFVVVQNNLRIIDILSLSLILGGGIGNLVDRLFKGGIVIDFMIVTVGSWKTAIFNVADLSIIGGLALLAISLLPWFSRSRHSRKEAGNPTPVRSEDE